MGVHVLETERLRLERPVLADVAGVFAILGDPLTVEHNPSEGTGPALMDNIGHRRRDLVTARVAAVAGTLFILVVAFRGGALHVAGWAFMLALYVITLANYRYWIVRAGVRMRPRHLLFLE